jgi:hypothetical protein
MFKEIFSTLAISGGVIGGILFTTFGKLNLDDRHVGWFERFMRQLFPFLFLLGCGMATDCTSRVN